MTIDEIYYMEADRDMVENKFETRKSEALFDRLVKRVPEIEGEGPDDPMSMLCDLIMYERENSFKIGYQVAISLILEGRAK